MPHIPFFDPERTYEENFTQGPFGAFADGKVFQEAGEPRYTVFGQAVYLPFGIPAGPLLNGKYVKAALDKALTFQSTRPSERVNMPALPGQMSWPFRSRR